ncbi:MAG: sensor histidine kinase [Armatimonadota bacterium]
MLQENICNERELPAGRPGMKDEMRELMSTARLEAGSQLAAWIAHQINNPLGSISGNAQLLARRIRQDIPDPNAAEKCLRYVSEIQGQTERCARVTGDMLDFTHVIEPNLNRIDIRDAIREGIELAKVSHPAMQVGIDTVNWSDLPPIRADKGWLVRAIFELVSNAAQASPRGFTHVDARAVPGCNNAEIRVHDSGPGIPVDVLPRVFDPFFSTRGKSRGLGLTLSSEMLRKMGGGLHIEKSDRNGSIFAITIPIWGRHK